MSLIVEDGTGRADADSLASIDFADDYHSKRANLAWAEMSLIDQEAALRKATDYLMLEYGDRWKGERQYQRQALDWPRYGAVVDRYETGYDDVPLDIQKATASLALRASAGELLSDVTQAVKSERVEGVVSVEYQDHSSPVTRYPEVDRMIRKYLKGGAYTVPIVLG